MMTAMDLSDFAWRKSSRSNENGYGCVEVGLPGWRKGTRSNQDGGNCVEVALAPEAVGVRDSKNPHGPALMFPQASWTAFLTAHDNRL
jgi:hypothetical protein